MLNVAMQVWLEHTKEDSRANLRDSLTGPLRAQGLTRPEDEHAPAWWHGEDAAYAETMAALGALRRR